METIHFNEVDWGNLMEPTQCINGPRCEVRLWDLPSGKVTWVPQEETCHETGAFLFDMKNGSQRTWLTVKQAIELLKID